MLLKLDPLLADIESPVIAVSSLPDIHDDPAVFQQSLLRYMKMAA